VVYNGDQSVMQESRMTRWFADPPIFIRSVLQYNDDDVILMLPSVIGQTEFDDDSYEFYPAYLMYYDTNTGQFTRDVKIFEDIMGHFSVGHWSPRNFFTVHGGVVVNGKVFLVPQTTPVGPNYIVMLS